MRHSAPCFILRRCRDQIAADLGHLVPSCGVVGQVNAISHACVVAVSNLKKIDGQCEADSVQALIGLGYRVCQFVQIVTRSRKTTARYTLSLFKKRLDCANSARCEGRSPIPGSAGRRQSGPARRD